MPISLECECGRKFRVKDEASGKKVRCPDCQKVQLVAAPDDISFEEHEALELSNQRRSPNRSKKVRSKSRSGLPVRTLVTIVVAICTFLIASYVGYQFLGRNKAANANPDVVTTPSIQPTKSLYQTIKFPLPPIDPSKYGGPAPEGQVISPLLVLEMELMEVHKELTKDGRKYDEKDPNIIEALPFITETAKRVVQRHIVRLREHDPKLFCHSESYEALLASCDEQTLKNCFDEYNRLYPRAKRELFEFPDIIESCHPSVQKGEATIGRVQAMIHLINGEVSQSRKYTRGTNPPPN